MPIDTSIYNQIQQPKIQSPLNALAEVEQFKQLRNQNALADMKMSEYQRSVAEENALRQAYASNADPKARLEALAKVSPKGYQAEAKFQTEQQKSQREADKERIALSFQRFEAADRITAGVKDQAGWTQAKQQAIQEFGPEVGAQIPDIYDPAEVERKRMQAMDVKTRLEQEWKQKGYGLDVRKTDETQRHNKATEGLTLRGQNQTDARSRDANNVPEYKQDENGNWIALPKRVAPGQQITAQPVFGPDGKPLAGGGKMTEDQGKATGWLVQAENAFKNMNSAVASTPSAAKPGLPDVVAGIPSMGIGGAVANTMRGADRQKFMQGSSSLSEALLRAATGAGVNKDEAAQKIRELTPVFGDDAATIKQKMDAIPLYIESLKVRAGPGAKKASSIAGTGAPVKTAKFLGFE